jgi:hypothetical protein
MASTTHHRITTSAAAALAGVAISTIRTWCRKGAVAASRTTGRWMIEARSLTRRINLGRGIDGDAQPAPLTEVKGTVPEVADIETAARAYEQARVETNTAARAKKGAAKILDKTPDGQYGTVTVERFESSRQVIDQDAVKALLAAHGLEVPMKTCSASLVLTFAEEATTTQDAAELAHAA